MELKKHKYIRIEKCYEYINRFGSFMDLLIDDKQNAKINKGIMRVIISCQLSLTSSGMCKQ